MKKLFLCSCVFLSCTASRTFTLNTTSAHHLTGSAFYRTATSYNWQKRDSLAVEEILSGNIPSFLKKFVRINVSVVDSATSQTISGYYFVAPDYLAVGNDNDWARIPLTPMASQKICDSFHCFLPTRKMVDDIYYAAAIKLEPVPMYAFRDSTVTMWQHHLIIEGQRQGRKGLIAGIKKDVVISGKISRGTKTDKVAIYGWHKPGGFPIQPLYTGHVNWYVDYSHGTRLVSRTVVVKGKEMDYMDVLKHPVYHKLLCDELYCDFYQY
jgi:hypothetical protein